MPLDPRALQFGAAEPGLSYRERPSAFGIALRGGKVACVLVDRGDGSYFDLPGGAVDGAETPQQAVVREFREETGLTVAASPPFAAAAQRFRRSTGEPLNNLALFMAVEVEAEDRAAKVEPDHALVWLDPVEALTRVRHEAHAWALTAWLRSVA
ncbi:MAG TPA: NUDIX domain-containing protein [Caulobacteraceae bacterium]|jgi:8-oxo-dGTP diphosphatase